MATTVNLLGAICAFVAGCADPPRDGEAVIANVAGGAYAHHEPDLITDLRAMGATDIAGKLETLSSFELSDMLERNAVGNGDDAAPPTLSGTGGETAAPEPSGNRATTAADPEPPAADAIVDAALA